MALGRTIRLIVGLPSVTLAVSSSEPGQEIRAELLRRTLGIPTGRLARAVLVVPSSAKEYLSGRKRHALRTNLNRARDLGITASRVDDQVEFIDAVRNILLSRGNSEEKVAELICDHRVDEGWAYLARNSEKIPLAFAVWIVDRDCAMLRVQMSSLIGKESTLARHVLHMAAVEDLVSNSVHHLVVESALAIDAAHGYFQHLLGFQPANIRLDSIPLV
jgi:hypothetical protein